MNESCHVTHMNESRHVTHVNDSTYDKMWHDSFMCVTWLIHVCDMTWLILAGNLSGSLLNYVSFALRLFWTTSFLNIYHLFAPLCNEAQIEISRPFSHKSPFTPRSILSRCLFSASLVASRQKSSCTSLFAKEPLITRLFCRGFTESYHVTHMIDPARATRTCRCKWIHLQVRGGYD